MLTTQETGAWAPCQDSQGPLPPLKAARVHGAHRGCRWVWGHAGTGRPLGVACRVHGVHPGGPLTPRPHPRVEAQAGLSPHVPPRTFNYILRELPKVPTHVPVCVLGNYRDMGEHRVILPDDVRDVLDHLDRWVHGCPQTHLTPHRDAPVPWIGLLHCPCPSPGHPPSCRPRALLETDSGRVTAEHPPCVAGMSARPWASMGGCTVRPCRGRRPQRPGLGVHRRTPCRAEPPEPQRLLLGWWACYPLANPAPRGTAPRTAWPGCILGPVHPAAPAASGSPTLLSCEQAPGILLLPLR